MFASILFAIDDYEALPGAVPVVAAYARRWGAFVLVAHVPQPRKGWFDGPGRSPVARISREPVAGGGRAAGVDVPIMVVRGTAQSAAATSRLSGW